ncbi:hypothetical protein MVI01_41680 [Myxococcus virescens]|uniref:Uncharacterized protein n=1 Tax=Myxococcus virescens TaxID=83456 RepID=A0A511HG92_9BACT|nr:hypothetical protein MVI01_41680 [Myxococcus virescens]
MDLAAPAWADAAEAPAEARMKNPSNTSLEVLTIHANLLQRGGRTRHCVRSEPRIGQEGPRGRSALRSLGVEAPHSRDITGHVVGIHLQRMMTDTQDAHPALLVPGA